MKITKLVPLFQNKEFDYTAEINLTKKQLEFISNVGLGVLLQAGAMSFMFGEEENDVVFEEKENKKEEKTIIEGTSSEAIIPQPATE